MKYISETHPEVQVSIGINSGPLVAAVVGKKKFAYGKLRYLTDVLTSLDIWGDPVNVASRMSTTAPSHKIQVSEETFNYLKDSFKFEKRGEVNVKGKGLMTTYFLLEKIDTKTSSPSSDQVV